MSAQQTFDTPRTADAITNILKQLSLPIPDRAGYQAISQAEGAGFAQAVARAANEQTGAGAVHEYILNVLTAAHPHAREAIAIVGCEDPDLVKLIAIAKNEGGGFRHAITMARSASGIEDRESARIYLGQLLDEYGVQRGEERLTSPAPADVAPAIPTKLVENVRTFPTERAEHVGMQRTEEKAYGESHHVYAGSAAVCFAECEGRQAGKRTVMVEVAQVKGDHYDWQGKILVLLSPSELPLVLGHFAGLLDKLEIKGHGKNREKAMTFVNQGNQFFLTVICRGQAPRAVPIPAKEGYPITAMLLRQMHRNDPHLSTDLILKLVQRVCSMHAAPRTSEGQERGK